MNTASLLNVLAFLCLSSAPSAQQFIEFQTTLPPSPVPSTQNALLPGFDPALGVLRSVEITVSGWVNGSLSFENTNPVATVAPNYSVGAYLMGSGPSGFLGSAPNPAFEYTPQPPPPLSAFDGTLDFAGSSALTIPFVNQGGTGAPSITYPIFADQSLAEVMVAVALAGGLALVIAKTEFTGGSPPSGIQEAHTISAGITLRVRYNYDPLPTIICRGSQSSGCPCGNSSVTNSGGCRNSTGGITGGVLGISGNASLANDTLQLLGSAMPSTAPVLYFQGTSFSYAQTAFGDGLLCVGGSLIRLGVKFNVGGASSYPSGDPAVSISGGVVTPGNRYYQAYYRDTAAFCTSATHNLTNGYAVAWQP